MFFRTPAGSISAVAASAILIGSTASAVAQELGHYGPGLADVRDLVVPAKPGFYFKQYDYYYTSDAIHDADGDEVSSIPLPRGGTVDVDVDVDIYVFAPTFMWVSDWQILGARYAAYAIPTFGNSSVGASLSTQTGRGVAADESDFGIGDLFVQPLWLGWTGEQFDAAIGYGFYAPTGEFEAGASDNIGLGFWSHQFQAAAAWYPWPERGTALVGAVTYEINHDVEDMDVTPGDRLSLNLGISQFLPLGPPELLLEVGAVAYGQWQMTDDEGADAFRPDVHDQIYGVGPQIGLVYVPLNAAVTFKWAHEIAAESRFEGDNLTLNFAVGF
jgi:hypothetical protein